MTDALSEVELAAASKAAFEIDWPKDTWERLGPGHHQDRYKAMIRGALEAAAYIRATKPVASDDVGKLEKLFVEMEQHHGRWRYWDDRHTIFTSVPERVIPLARAEIKSLADEVERLQIDASKHAHDAATVRLERDAAEAEVGKLSAELVNIRGQKEIVRLELIQVAEQRNAAEDCASTAYSKGVEDAAKIVTGFSAAQNYLPVGVDGGWLAIRDLDMAGQIRALNQEERHE